MRPITLINTTIALAAVAPEPVSHTTLPFFDDRYRTKGDPCRRIGEENFTGEFLYHIADLVGCPADMDILGVFVSDTGAA
ncbi:hypothetical protein C8N43_1727 [Litoreibacter ponti]|uniref:Uncharacterized protein n=1 Tax=Litoreibacter ponti TaxID=1510457 RepID=A0A2T6BLY7_9RHOB|nr:hypothetical protein [Litoreibacter ponti]PTX57062.1 hypothetical protein C8N43_1727 [Litoreibacter ponti]